MRKFVSLGLVVMLSAGAPSSVLAAAQQNEAQTATLTGTTIQTDLRPLSNARVQIRSNETGERVASTISGQAGEFLFTGLQPGGYIIEVVDASGRIVGMTAPFSLRPGAAGSMSVVAVAGGVMAGSSRGGLSIFGLGPVTSMAVLGAAGAAAVTAVVATRPDASPSR